MTTPQLTQSFLEYVNRSGYPFQYAVVQRILAHSDEWRVDGTEIPVSYEGGSTHIDLVAWSGRQVLLIGECKRANPAFSHWLFLRAPFTLDGHHREIWFERLWTKDDRHPVARIEVLQGFSGIRAWDIGLEVKTNLAGDPDGKGRNFNDAIAQVHRGVNGMISLLVKQQTILAGARDVIFLPVIFTTARLFTTDAPLHQADLSSGKLADVSNVKEEPWLWLSNNVSPDLLASIQRTGQDEVIRIPDFVHLNNSRVMAVVSASGIDAFLETAQQAFMVHLSRF